MKRALLVSTGTVAGLAAVLTYSGGETPAAIASDVPAGSIEGLGAPAPAAAQDSPAAPAAPAAAPSAAATKAAAAKPAAAKPAAAKPAKAAQAAPAPAATKAATKPGAPASTKAPAPAPTPTKTKAAPPPKPSGDFLGTAVTYKYGTLQMGIRVKDGKIVDAWAVSYPKGESQPYSEMAIPILRKQTIGATSASISGATGASLTSNAWSKSLAGAIAKAGI